MIHTALKLRPAPPIAHSPSARLRISSLFHELLERVSNRVHIGQQLQAAEVKGSGVFVNSSSKILAEISKLIQQGNITPHITQVFSFDQLPLAQSAVESGRAVGKVAVSLS